jgi:hypothetical protein
MTTLRHFKQAETLKDQLARSAKDARGKAWVLLLLVTLLVVTLLAISSSAEGQVAAVPASPSILELIQVDRAKAKTDEENEAPSIRESIRADRAKANADEENASKDRPWDRDANGKRPWDRKETPSK